MICKLLLYLKNNTQQRCAYPEILGAIGKVCCGYKRVGRKLKKQRRNHETENYIYLKN